MIANLHFSNKSNSYNHYNNMNNVKRSRIIPFILFIVCLFFTKNSFSQDGSLDLSFDLDGLVTTTVGTFDESGYAVAVQEDLINFSNRKILVAGQTFNGSNYDFIVVRFNNDGSLDNTFGNMGIVTTQIGSYDDKARTISIQKDGKILVAGLSYNGTKEDFAIVRYNANGSLDNTFNGTGIVTTSIGKKYDNIHSIIIQNDGKIVAAGFSETAQGMSFAVARYDSFGKLDNTFDLDGFTTTALGLSYDVGNKVLIQNDGKILVIGSSLQTIDYDIALVRYNADGSLDTSFDTDGKVTTKINGNFYEYGNSGVILNDGKILVVGSSNNLYNDFIVVKYNGDGSIDNTFGTNGVSITDFGTSTDFGSPTDIAVQSDNKIVVVGYSNEGKALNYTLVRYNSNGAVDQTFGNKGIVITDFGNSDDQIRSVAIQKDGKILAVGSSYNNTQNRLSIARYNNPSIDPIMNLNELVVNDYRIQPSPVQFNAVYKSKSSLNNASILIYNTLGQKINQITNLNGEVVNLDFSYLKNGLYYLIVYEDSKIIDSQKFIKKND